VFDLRLVLILDIFSHGVVENIDTELLASKNKAACDESIL
jgi:hypothetical protein